MHALCMCILNVVTHAILAAHVHQMCTYTLLHVVVIATKQQYLYVDGTYVR
jgi:hypothetical protein